MHRDNTSTKGPSLRRSAEAKLRHDLYALGILLLAYLTIAYMILPHWWRHYTHRQALDEAPKTTRTRDGISGDPLNVALIGTQDDVLHALARAGWRPADPTTFRTSLRISRSALIGGSYPDAPVSNLFLWGRRQDLAFEKPVGSNARKRHHVRFWWSDAVDDQGRALWLGAATYDRTVGFSHRTGQITHHIDPDVDQERDLLMTDLQGAGQLQGEFQGIGVGPTQTGRNGGGDLYRTDGWLTVGVLVAGRITP